MMLELKTKVNNLPNFGFLYFLIFTLKLGIFNVLLRNEKKCTNKEKSLVELLHGSSIVTCINIIKIQYNIFKSIFPYVTKHEC